MPRRSATFADAAFSGRTRAIRRVHASRPNAPARAAAAAPAAWPPTGPGIDRCGQDARGGRAPGTAPAAHGSVFDPSARDLARRAGPDAFAQRLGRYDAARVTRWTVRDVRSLGVGLAYLLPSFVLFAVFVFIPLGRTFYLSFYNTRATGAITTFAGLDQYVELLTSPTFRTGLVATALFAIYTVPLGIALGLFLAVLLNQRLRGINVFRTAMASTIAI